MDTKSFTRLLRKNSTEAEMFFWEKVRRRQVDDLKFRRQHPIRYSNTSNCGHSFIVDFYIPQQRLIIEIDGEIHESQKEYDSKRTEILKDLGYRVLRFKNHEVINNWERIELIILSHCSM